MGAIDGAGVLDGADTNDEAGLTATDHIASPNDGTFARLRLAGLL